MTKPCPPDLAAFKHEPADYEQPVEAVTVGQPSQQEAAEALRVAFMKVQQAKRGKPMREGPLKLVWDVVNAVPAALYHLDKMPEFEAGVTAEEVADRTQANETMRAAIEKARVLIGAGKGDHPNEAIRQCNINRAWHILRNALSGDSARPQANEAMREALDHWDAQATCWLESREQHARPGWMQTAIDKGRNALSGDSA